MKDKESEKKLTEDEIQANTLQAYLNIYDMASPEEQKKISAAIRGDGPDYTPSSGDLIAGYAVSALEEFQPRERALESAKNLRRAAERPDGEGPRNALGAWARVGKFLRRKR